MSSKIIRSFYLSFAFLLWGGIPLATSVAQVNAQCESCPVKPIQRAKQPAKPKVDWTTLASTYTHDTAGQRVDQFAQPTDPLVFERPDYVKSGYRHTRSSLQVGFSADHYHITEQWGNAVQPYGQWRYPFRPYGVPYDAWGPQLPQFLSGGMNVWNGRNQMPWQLPNHHGMHPMGPMAPGQPMPNPNMPNGAMIPPGGGGMGMNANGNLPNAIGPGFGHGFGPGFGHGRDGHGPGSTPWWNNGMNGSGIQVGPWNALPANQDEYYQQSPLLRD